MDSKITLSFDAEVIRKAKTFADKNHISLSRLTEFLYSRITSNNYQSLEDLPVSDWVNMVAEGEIEYQKSPKNRKALKSEYYKSKK